MKISRLTEQELAWRDGSRLVKVGFGTRIALLSR
jgi:hypothetical protein